MSAHCRTCGGGGETESRVLVEGIEELGRTSGVRSAPYPGPPVGQFSPKGEAAVGRGLVGVEVGDLIGPASGEVKDEEEEDVLRRVWKGEGRVAVSKGHKGPAGTVGEDVVFKVQVRKVCGQSTSHGRWKHMPRKILYVKHR